MSDATSAINNTSALAVVDPGERYRLARQKRAWDQEDPMVPQRLISQAGVEYGLAQMVTETWKPKKNRKILWWVIFGVLLTLGAAGFLVTMFSFFSHFGFSVTLAATLAAMVPLVTIIAVLIWLNRWYPQPRLALLAALLWGAGIAIFVAGYSNTSTGYILQLFVDPEFGHNALAPLVAPVIEETMKGLGVIVIMLWQRREIKSPLDGFIYAGFTAVGFAFTENIQYFGRFYDAFWFLFIQRGILGPFGHLVFTSMTGIVMGIALTRMRNKWAPLWVTPIGLASAMILHSLWNGVSSFGMTAHYLFYKVFWLPVFITWIITAIVVSSKQKRWIEMGLRPYVRAGWVHPVEANTVCSLRQRSRERRRLKRAGGFTSTKLIRQFHKAIAGLALDWVTAQRVGVTVPRINQAISTLQEIESMRQKIMAPSAVPVSGNNEVVRIAADGANVNTRIKIRPENS